MTHTLKAKIFTDLVLAIFKTNGALIAAGDQLAAQQGLTSSKWQVMGAVNLGAGTVSDIARLMGLTRQSVQRTINQLCQAKLCEFKENPNHKAAKLIQLTAKGKGKMYAMSQIQSDWANKMAESLTLKQLKATTKLLKQIQPGINHHEE